MAIQLKLKQCKGCKKQTYIFSKGECKNCAQKRYVAKSVVNQQKQTYKRISKAPTKRHQEAKQRELDAMLLLWAENEDLDGRCNCSECGKSLGFDRTHCAHVLSKGAFPALRANKSNMIILCLECHTQFDCDKRSEMQIWDYVEELTLELKGLKNLPV